MLAIAAAPAAAGSTGGTSSEPIPKISSFSCVNGCVDYDATRAGSVVRLSGRNLAGAVKVVFLGGRGSGDDVAARPRTAKKGRRKLDRNRYLDVTVPKGASTGPLVAVNVDGDASAPTKTGLDIVSGVPHGPNLVSGNGVDLALDSHRVYYGGKRTARASYLLTGTQAAEVRVDLVSVNTGALVTSWSPGTVQPKTPQTVEWNAPAGQQDGRYQVQVYAGSRVAQRALDSGQSARPNVADSFMFLKHIFPIRGRHSYGDGQNRYGADRGDHSHAGQDVLAACGIPLVAARGGRVEGAGYGAGGGNFVAIDGAGTNVDYVYMHLRDRPLVHEGQQVFTGQPIGYVGQTGDATTCHLHFEMWNGPWFSGGHTFDPLPYLQAWDRAG